MLVQTEVERVKFAVRSYIRTRLYKASTSTYLNVPSRLANDCDLQIEKFARYIAATPEVQEKLSQAELDHAKRCAFRFCCLHGTVVG